MSSNKYFGTTGAVRFRDYFEVVEKLTNINLMKYITKSCLLYRDTHTCKPKER